MRAAFDDIRFSSASGKKLSYWIESYTSGQNGRAIVWVKSFANETTIYVYYGNANAVTASAGNDVFELFDDTFTSSLWHYGENCSYEAGELILTGTGGGGNTGWVATNAFFSAPYVMEYRGRITQKGSNANMGSTIHLNDNNARISAFATGYLTSDMDNANGAGFQLYKFNGGWTSLSDPSFVSVQDTYYNIRVVAKTSGIEQYVFSDRWGSLLQTASTTDTEYNSGYIGLIQIFGESRYDWVRVRKYAATEPTCALGEYQPNQPNHLSIYKFLDFPTLLTKTFSSSNDIQLSKPFSNVNELRLSTSFASSNDTRVSKPSSSSNDIQISKSFSSSSDIIALFTKLFSNTNDIGISKAFSSSIDICLSKGFSSSDDLLLSKPFASSNDLRLSEIFNCTNDIHLNKTFSSSNDLLLSKVFPSTNDIQIFKIFQSSNDIHLWNIFSSSNAIFVGNLLTKIFSSSNNIQMNKSFSSSSDIDVIKLFESLNDIKLYEQFVSTNDIYVVKNWSSYNDVLLNKSFSSSSDIIAYLTKIFGSSNDIHLHKAFPSSTDIQISKLFSSSNDIITVITTTRFNHPLTLVISQNERTLVIFKNTRAVTIKQ